jgi:hypothetical protein
MSVDLKGFGHVNSVDVATNTTLSLTAHSGLVVNVTATCAITLPAVAVGHRFPIRVGAEGITVTISPDANDLIAGAGASNAGAGTNNKDVIFTNQPAGSYIVLEYMSGDGFAIVESRGDFTFEG